jgi:hypothetical protein
MRGILRKSQGKIRQALHGCDELPDFFAGM